VADVIAWLAFLMSGVSLGWQIKTWKAGGPVVVVTAAVTSVAGRDEDAVICVTVRNDGRAAVEVDGCTVALGLPINEGATYEMPMAPSGKRRLEGQSSFPDYRLHIQALVSAFDAVNLRDYGFHAAAHLATGVVVYSTEPIPLSRFLT
jgi:hypothetical protein